MRPSAAALVLALACGGCAAAGPAPVEIAEAAAPMAPAPEPAPAPTWLRLGKSMIGPRLGDRTILILSGKLGELDGAGRVRLAGGPPRLLQVIAVPTPSGAVVIARDRHQLYRFDADLRFERPLMAIEQAFDVVGSLPGRAVLSTVGGLLLVDVENGAVSPARAALPEAPPILQVSFHSMSEGTALFDHAGPARSGDGGKTWLPLDAGRVAGEPAAPLQKWLERGNNLDDDDPLTAALRQGVAAEPGWALVAHPLRSNLIAHVDLGTGYVDEVVDAPDCTLFPRDRKEVWLVCGGHVRPVARRMKAIREALAQPANPPALPFELDRRNTAQAVLPFADGATVFRRGCGGGAGIRVVERDRRWGVVSPPALVAWLPSNRSDYHLAALTRLSDGRLAGAFVEGDKLVVSVHDAQGGVRSGEVDLPWHPRPTEAFEAAAIYERARGQVAVVLDAMGSTRHHDFAAMVSCAIPAGPGKLHPEIEVATPEPVRVVIRGRYGFMKRGASTLRTSNAGATWHAVDGGLDWSVGELGVADPDARGEVEIGERRRAGLLGWGEAPDAPEEPPVPPAPVTFSPAPPPPEVAPPAVIVCKHAGPWRHLGPPLSGWTIDSSSGRYARVVKASSSRGWELEWFDMLGRRHVSRGSLPVELAGGHLTTYDVRTDAAAIRIEVSSGRAAQGLVRGDSVVFTPLLDTSSTKPVLADKGTRLAWLTIDSSGTTVQTWSGSGPILGARIVSAKPDSYPLIAAARDRLWLRFDDGAVLPLPVTAMATTPAHLPLAGWRPGDWLTKLPPPKPCTARDKGDAVALNVPLGVVWDLWDEASEIPAYDELRAVSAGLLIDPANPAAACLSRISRFAEWNTWYDFVRRRGELWPELQHFEERSGEPRSPSARAVSCERIDRAEYERRRPHR